MNNKTKEKKNEALETVVILECIKMQITVSVPDFPILNLASQRNHISNLWIKLASFFSTGTLWS